MTLPRRLIPHALIAAIGTLLLAGCLILPGKFDSTLDLRTDGTFRFHYAGEIVFLPLTDAMMAQARQKTAGAAPSATPDQTEVFSEKTCTKPETGEMRPCSADEIAAQRREFEARKRSGKVPGNALDGDRAEAMMTMMGGMMSGGASAAPPDGETIAAMMRHQQGWSKVQYRGNGVFEVVFDAAGPLTHDFIFPTIEKLPLMVPLLTVTRHADGSVRATASGFTGGISGLGPLLGAGKAATTSGAKPFPMADGTFTLTTNGTILANNTEDGPASAAGGQKLEWKVNAARKEAPTALIGMGNTASQGK